MEDKIYTITLSDGTKIENLRLNGNNFISSTKIDSSIFDGNLSSVAIGDGETEMVYSDLALVQNVKYGEEWWFVLRQLSRDEIERAKLRADVDFISMITDAGI